MKSVFSKISQIKKQKLDKIESELFSIKNSIRKLGKEIKEIYVKVKELKIPREGKVNLLSLFQEQRRLLNTQKDRLTRELHVKNLELSKKYQEYKLARIDYEKIKYLEEEEIARKIKKLKKDEQKDLDEISNLLFKRTKV